MQKVSGVCHGLSYIQGGNLYLLNANCKGGALGHNRRGHRAGDRALGGHALTVQFSDNITGRIKTAIHVLSGYRPRRLASGRAGDP